MRKLLFVVNNFNIGGPQKSLLALLDNINYDLFDVSLISLEPDGTLIKHLNKNVKLIQVSELFTAYTLPSKNTFYYFKIMLKHRKFLAAIDFLWILFKFLLNKDMNPERQRFWKRHRKELPELKDQFDASFGVSSGLSTYFIVDCIKSAKKYHWVRGDYSRTSIDKNIDEYYFSKVNGSLSVSKECSDIFTNIFPFMKGKMQVFYNVLPIKFYERTASVTNEIPYDQSIKFLTVTRLDLDKGLDIAVDACEVLLEKGIEFKWYILGDGKYRDKVEKIIEEKNLKKYIFLLGFKLNTFEYIKRCDIFVHPSRSEGKSNAVDEALYLKKPIVITNYTTVREQITDNVNGFICAMSGGELADKIEYVLNNMTNLNEKLSKNAIYDYDKDPTDFFMNLL
ncbi:glycosyltransferase involved in cell wall biosynthesis [Cytobacillus oceanisediminis]|uniref:Glycosyltransferase involved in cell wall biosynthesis n=1 Tax=Cytobacillus oceanisediminis TaxID=665099 RepID=A0A2V3A394_9BACI|nr:glycosyltransferase [Cytobacillus oceanisediminis]PWW31276.1 glycosyltransferase involved in cell wall biosynthesis [Cytobacillus oceanisediminis]